MGFAKYLEDNIDLHNRRMYKKNSEDFKSLEELKNSRIDKKEVSLESKYLSILENLNQIEAWLNIIENMWEKISAGYTFKVLENQKQQLQKTKDMYIDYMYDPKFKSYRNKNDYKLDGIAEYENIIIKSYIEYFMERLKNIKNETTDESIIINDLYWDIEMILEEFLSINTKSLKLPLARYVRENILPKKEYSWRKCSNCGGMTYMDFKNCIACKYPQELI